MSCCLTYSYAEPACLNFNIQQGGSWRFTVTLYEDLAQTTPFDLTGYTGTMNFVRADTHALVVAATVTIAAPTTGVIACSLTAVQTAALSPTVALLHDLLLSKAAPAPTFYVVRGSTTIIEGYSG